MVWGPQTPSLRTQDLELPPELAAPVPAAAESAVFAAPTPGVPASQRWLQKGNLAADHVAAGAFESAMRLLNRRARARGALPRCCVCLAAAPPAAEIVALPHGAPLVLCCRNSTDVTSANF